MKPSMGYESGGLNMTFFFWISISFMLVYRFFSCLQIWAISGVDADTVQFVGNNNQEQKQAITDMVSRTRCRRVLWQLLDLEMFDILYLSHTAGLKGSSSPQKSLKLLIAQVEASVEVES